MKNRAYLSRSMAFFLSAGMAAMPITSNAAKLGESTFSVFLGQKQLDDNDWGPVDGQAEWGFVADLGRKDSVVTLVMSYLSSEDESTRDGNEYTGETWELGLGIRKPFRMAPDIAPYLEAGVAYMDATLEQLPATTGTASDSAFGVWAGGGVNFAVGERLMVGVGARYTSASATLLGQDREIGGLHVGVTAGIGF